MPLYAGQRVIQPVPAIRRPLTGRRSATGLLESSNPGPLVSSNLQS